MLLRRNLDKKTGIYRSKDAIENFRFRVTLKTLNSFVKVPKFNAEQLSDSENSDKIVWNDFKWQQKRFSAKEIEQFRDVGNCKTDTQKRYHQIISDENASEYGGQKSSSIFSYVMEDKFSPAVDELESCSNNELVANVDNFGDWYDLTAGARGKLFIDDDEPQTAIRSRYKKLGKFETMYIMADLESEIVLAIIKFRANDGLLLVYPDFNNIDTSPYFREIDSNSKRIYQYSIQNLSNERRQYEWSLKNDMDKLASKLSDLYMKSSSVFELPQRDCRFVCLCMEIESAQYFSYDHIHVKFRFVIPNRCTVINGDIRGSTHSSHKKRAMDGHWLIGFCHELNIVCDPGYQFSEHLKIFCEVVSIDWWGRERTEGYTMTVVPLRTTESVETLSCYRDLGNDSWIEWLERYFIGGRKKVLLDQFYANSYDEMSMLNRYGNKTKSTGLLNIKWNIITQRDVGQNVEERDMSRNKQSNRRHMAIAHVLNSYREARQRLEDIMS